MYGNRSIAPGKTVMIPGSVNDVYGYSVMQEPDGHISEAYYACTLVKDDGSKSFTMHIDFPLTCDPYCYYGEHTPTISVTGDSVDNYDQCGGTNFYKEAEPIDGSEGLVPAGDKAGYIWGSIIDQSDYHVMTFTWDEVDMSASVGQVFANTLLKKLVETFDEVIPEGTSAKYDKTNKQVVLKIKQLCNADICSSTSPYDYSTGASTEEVCKAVNK